MTDRTTLACGSLAVPSDWDSKASATLAMPAQNLSLKLPGKGADAKSPQPNLVVTLTEGDSSAEDALSKVVDALTTALPSLERGENESVSFADGGAGAACSVTFPAGNMQVTQLHVLRQVGGRVVHICATVPSDRAADLAKLREVAQTYQPPGA